MRLFLHKPYVWAKLYAPLLTAAFAFTLLDAFVIPKTYVAVEQTQPSADGQQPVLTEETDIQNDLTDSDSGSAVITENSYLDENIRITIETVEEYDTIFYVADIQVSDPNYLKTALAQDTYGRNIKATTSAMAADHDAILAINGDYYGYRDSGYVLRNGILYRNSGTGDALVIDDQGNFSIVDQSMLTEEITADAWQILSFGPALVADGTIFVDASSEVSKAKNSNPRTAIGQISEGHYMIIVSDGRTADSEGLSLLQLAQEFYDRGAKTAYNLDGGGSSTMVFNGNVINTPSSGRSGREREVSDIVYFGYE